jgi:chromosome segregation ATPase
MQKEKYRLESDLKNAEMKLILFFEELILLKSMEGKDQELTKRLAKCRQDKGQILREINEISKKLRDKKKEIDDIKEREESLMARFHELCPEGSDKYDEIRKFFEKIIKRRRRAERHTEKEAGDGEDEDEAEEEEDFEEEEEDDEDENNVVSLPQEEYKIDEIEKLRNERLDLYDDKEKILSFINDLES